jgi:hypothetical protein
MSSRYFSGRRAESPTADSAVSPGRSNVHREEPPSSRHALKLVFARSLNRMPDPATRSTTVRDTSTSEPPANAATRAPMWTLMPLASSPSLTISPVRSPARMSMPRPRSRSRISPTHTGSPVRGRRTGRETRLLPYRPLGAGDPGGEEATVFRSNMPITSSTDEQGRRLYCVHHIGDIAFHEGTGNGDAIRGSREAFGSGPTQSRFVVLDHAWRRCLGNRSGSPCRLDGLDIGGCRSGGMPHGHSLLRRNLPYAFTRTRLVMR